VEVTVDPKEVKVGDPVVVKTTIRGRGNLDTVTAPEIVLSDKFKTYEPQVAIKGGKKVYEQVIIPKSPDIKEMPAVSFSFFDPGSKRYKTIQKGPFSIEVARVPESESGVKMFSMSSGSESFYSKEQIGEDIIHLKENIGDLSPKGRFAYNSLMFWAGQFVLTAAFFAFYVLSRRKERMLSDKSYARFLKAPKNARKGIAAAAACLDKKDFSAFYDIIFKVLQEYLAGRFNLHRGNIQVQAVRDKLTPGKYDEAMLKELEEIFSKCEMARYAPAVSGEKDPEGVLKKTREIINYLEKIK